MKPQSLLIPLFLLIITPGCFAQLSGVYTVGDSTCDFVTMNNAANALQTEGISGNVRLNIKEGTYNGFTFSGFIPDYTDTVFVNTETGLGGGVVFEGSTNILYSHNIYFKHLRFEALEYQEYSCVKIRESHNIVFDSCTFKNIYDDNLEYQEALLDLMFLYELPAYTVEIRNSSISSPVYAIYTSGSSGKCKFINDTIEGVIEGNFPITYTGNVIHLFSEPFGHVSIRGSIGNSRITGDVLDIYGDCYENEIYNYSTIRSENIKSNHFYNKGSCIYSSGVRITDNICDSSFSIDFCNNSKIIGNTFHGDVRYVGESSLIANNFFYAYFDPGNTSNTNFIGNTFGYGGYFWDPISLYYSGKVKNNIFYSLLINPSNADLSNNNFIPDPDASVNYYGVDSYHYDPQYTSPVDLHSKNPALIHKGAPDNLVSFDIDSIPRPEYPTIGANEILCFSSSYDTIYAECDSVCLKLCQDTVPGYFWTPSWLFADPYSMAPVIYPSDDIWVYLNSPATGILDSLFINTSFSQPFAEAITIPDDLTVHFINVSNCSDSIKWIFGDGKTSSLNDVKHTYTQYGLYSANLIVYNKLGSDTVDIPVFLSCLSYYELMFCGDSVQLHSCLADFTGYYWSPDFLFSDPTDPDPWIRPEMTRMILLNHVNWDYPAVCYVEVVPRKPQASLTYERDTLAVTFHNTSRCGFIFHWDFGDSTFSSEGDPVHIYPGAGSYEGKLIAGNDEGADTAEFVIEIAGIPGCISGNFSIRPNPVGNTLFIEPGNITEEYYAEISDEYGKILISTRPSRGNTQISTEGLSAGFYFVTIISGNTRTVRKIIKNT